MAYIRQVGRNVLCLLTDKTAKQTYALFIAYFVAFMVFLAAFG